MSRIGRNYLEIGFYTEVLFRKKNVRFIAISNNVDSALNDGSNEFAPFLNIMNDSLIMFIVKHQCFRHLFLFFKHLLRSHLE